MQKRDKKLTKFSPFTEQEEFLRGDKRYLGYISGVGAGKTYAGIIRTFLNMEYWNPGEMGAIVAPTRQMVVNVIIPEMRDLGLLEAWEYKSSYSDEPGIHAPNGSRALIMSADNDRTIERLRGLNLAWGWMDEEAVIDPRAREILMQRLRTGEYRNLYLTTTPKGKNHTYDFFVGKQDADEKRLGQATLYETADRLAIVGVPTSANPYTPDDYKDAMGADLPEEIRAQEVQGQFIEFGGGILTKDMLTFVDAGELPERDFHWVMGVDIGVETDPQKARDNDTDYWAASLIGVDRLGSQAYLLDLHRKRGMSLRQGVAWLSKIASAVPNPSIHIESNAAQRFFLDECESEGLNVSPVHNTQNKEERLLQLSIPVENDSLKFVNREIDPQLGYDPRWQDMVQEWIAFPEGNHDDLIDSIEIAMNAIDVGGRTSILGANPYDNSSDDEPDTWGSMWRR